MKKNSLYVMLLVMAFYCTTLQAQVDTIAYRGLLLKVLSYGQTDGKHKDRGQITVVGMDSSFDKIYWRDGIGGNIEIEGIGNGLFTITGIESGAFANNTKLKNLQFKSLSFIGDSAFWGCSNLVEVKLEVNDSIGAYAFHYCNNLQYPDIYNNASYSDRLIINEYAFDNCPLELIVSVGVPPIIQQEAFSKDQYENTWVNVYDRDLEQYRSDSCWNRFSHLTVLMSVENIINKDEMLFFDLLGRPVTHPTKGIYIQNGKKVIIK